MFELKLDQNQIQLMVDDAIEQQVTALAEQLAQDPAWTRRIESLINQTVRDLTMQKLGLLDVNRVVRQRVDETLSHIRTTAFPGLVDQSTEVQVTIMDETTVVENKLTTRNLDVIDTVKVANLVVTGLINTDNRSWQELAQAVSQQTMEKLNLEWRQSIVDQVAEAIRTNGVDFAHVTIQGQALLVDGKFSTHIKESSLETVGTLRRLEVHGETHLNNTAHVLNRRVGINTAEPEMALSVWDEEVAVLIGKHKEKTAYIGTRGPQGVAIGVNRVAQLDIDAEGLTTVKKLRVGLHRISHNHEVPGWSGTKGDIVFNSNPTDTVFAWICLGAFRWRPLRSTE